MSTTTPRPSTLLAFVAAAGRHLAGAAAGFVLIPVIAHALGAEALGAWTLLGTCSFLLGISDLGLSTCVQRAVAARDVSGARRLVGLTLAVIAVTSPLLAVIAFMLLDATLKPAIGSGSRVVTLVAMIAGVVGAFAFPFRGYLLLKGGMRTLAIARGLASIGQVVVTIALLGVTKSLLAPAIALLFATVTETAVTVAGALSHDRHLPVLPRVSGDRRWILASLREGSATLAINGAFLAAARIDVLMLAAVASLPVVAAYGVISRVVDQAYVLAKQVSAAVLPRLGNEVDRPDAVRLGTRVMGILVASGMPALALDGGPLLVAWGGPAVGGPMAAGLLMLLASAAVVAASQEVAASALTMSSASAWQSASCLIAGAAVNVAMSLIGAWVGGPLVIAAATLVGNLVTALLIWKRAAVLLSWGRTDIAGVLSPVLVAFAASTVVAWIASTTASRDARTSVVMAATSSLVGLLAGAAACLRGTRPRAAVAQRLLGGD